MFFVIRTLLWWSLVDILAAIYSTICDRIARTHAIWFIFAWCYYSGTLTYSLMFWDSIWSELSATLTTGSKIIGSWWKFIYRMVGWRAHSASWMIKWLKGLFCCAWFLMMFQSLWFECSPAMLTPFESCIIITMEGLIIIVLEILTSYIRLI